MIFAAALTITSVILTLDAQYFSNMIKDVAIENSGNVFMLDSAGVMIANVRPELVEGQKNFIELGKTDPLYKITAAVHTRMVNGKTGTDEYSYETGDRICAFCPVTAPDGWSVGAVAPIREMTASVLYIIAALLACSLVCMVLVALLVGRYVASATNPIHGP